MRKASLEKAWWKPWIATQDVRIPNKSKEKSLKMLPKGSGPDGRGDGESRVKLLYVLRCSGCGGGR